PRPLAHLPLPEARHLPYTGLTCFWHARRTREGTHVQRTAPASARPGHGRRHHRGRPVSITPRHHDRAGTRGAATSSCAVLSRPATQRGAADRDVKAVRAARDLPG